MRKPPYYVVDPKTSGRILQKIEGLEEYNWAFDGDLTLISKPPKEQPKAVEPKAVEPKAEPAESKKDTEKSTEEPVLTETQNSSGGESRSAVAG